MVKRERQDYWFLEFTVWEERSLNKQSYLYVDVYVYIKYV